MKRAELPDLHVHDLRHTCATRLRACQINQQTISDLMCHSKGTVTDLYTSALFDELERAVEKITAPTERVSVSLASLIATSRSK